MAKLLLDSCTCADHVFPVSQGGMNDTDNLVSVCWKCNLEKRDSDPTSWIARLQITKPSQAQDWDRLLSPLKKRPYEQMDEDIRIPTERERLKMFMNPIHSVLSRRFLNRNMVS